MNDKINPSHYKNHPSGIEVIEITEMLDFCVGNAVKYVLRAGKKDTETTETDLQKALWYLEKAINDESLGFAHFKNHLKNVPKTLEKSRFSYLQHLIQKYLKYEITGSFIYEFLTNISHGDIKACRVILRSELITLK
jgi:hypothetical protein